MVGPVSKVAGVASAALAKASGKLAGGGALPAEAVALVEEPPAAVIPKTRADALRKSYQRAEKRVDAAQEALKAAKGDILAAMGPSTVLQVAETGKPLAEHKTVTALTFDQTRFRKEHPDQAAGYMKERVQSRFRLLV